MATLRDVAETVGVSIRTVTRVLSGNGYVSHAVRGRVLEAAADLDYSPDPAARSLRLGRSSEIVVVSHSVDELHMAKIAGMEEVLSPRGFALSVVICRDADARRTLIADVRRRKPSGVAVIASGFDVAPFMQGFSESGIRAVAIDTSEGRPAVFIDRPAGVAEAVRHLVASGRRSICYVGPARSIERIDGYLAAMAEAGLMPTLFDPGPGERYRSSVEELLALHPGLDAIQAYSDERALQLLAGLHDRGVRVPDDVALVGFDDRWAARYSWPPLSTVAQPSREVGDAAARYLLAAIDGDADAECPIIPTRLVLRETT